MTDPWESLRGLTQARIGQGRAGHACSTAELLKFQRAHAEARDAVWSRWDAEGLQKKLKDLGQDSLLVASEAKGRAEFLTRPDLGRRLAGDPQLPEAELSVILSDGLSARALDHHFLPFWKVLGPRLKEAGLATGPLVLAPFGRVALSDPIGEKRRSRLAIILIGERPGLSATDSLGIYLTYEPRTGRTDAQRNCISNVRPPFGLSYELAAEKLVYLAKESLRLQLSGVGLKESASGSGGALEG